MIDIKGLEFKYPLDVEDLAMYISGKIREDYSGRGMYGKTCMGVVFNPTNVKQEDLEYLRGVGKIDSMGTDLIIYFPNIKG